MTHLVVDNPVPGFYEFRAHTPGVPIPAVIWREGENLKALVAGREWEPYAAWIRCAKGRPITTERYTDLLMRIVEARLTEPWSPWARPFRRIDKAGLLSLYI